MCVVGGGELCCVVVVMDGLAAVGVDVVGDCALLFLLLFSFWLMPLSFLVVVLGTAALSPYFIVLVAVGDVTATFPCRGELPNLVPRVGRDVPFWFRRAPVSCHVGGGFRHRLRKRCCCF